MSSSKQIEANRRNSKMSTGPRTPQGKKRVSQNATTHGLLSGESVLGWENLEDMLLLKENLVNSLAPEGALEEILVDRIASLTWRIRRATRMETGLIDWKRYSLNYHMTLPDFRVEEPRESSVMDKAIRDENMKRAIEVALVSFPDGPELGYIFNREGNSFATLSRYEAGLERSLFKALHEFQRLQASRQGRTVSPPVVVDINTDGDIEPR